VVEEMQAQDELNHFWQGFGFRSMSTAYRSTHCHQVSVNVATFTEIIVNFNPVLHQNTRSPISLNDLLNNAFGFGMEVMEPRHCKNCNASHSSERTTGIHTHPNVLIIFLEKFNNKEERINTKVDFPLTTFIPFQGHDNEEQSTIYDLFAAVNHKQSRSGDGGHFTAQCKIKIIEYWCKYNENFQLNNFINKKSTTKALAKYHPLAYILFYKKRETSVTIQIGIQAQQNNGVSKSLSDDNDGEQNHANVDSNKEQHMSVGENINQVDGTSICNQRAPHENIAIANVHCSSTNNANIYTRT
jgi:hypothetical protein